MQLEIDFESRVPLYVQIEEQIRAMISAGQLRSGERLPTIRDLADELQVNYNTVAQAYRQLDSEGDVSTQRGRGTFVTGIADDELAAEHRLRKLEAIADSAVTRARKLGYSPREFAAAVVRALSHWREDLGKAPE